MNYVQIDTQSDPESPTQPSSMNQKDLSKVLVKELHEIGISDAELDEHGYVYATIPATKTGENIPVICYCAHVDTAPDCSGSGVKPILHKAWNGNDIVLPDDPTIVVSTTKHPYLKERIGDDIITASGTTLLGADDKAGCGRHHGSGRLPDGQQRHPTRQNPHPLYPRRRSRPAA